MFRFWSEAAVGSGVRVRCPRGLCFGLGVQLVASVAEAFEHLDSVVVSAASMVHVGRWCAAPLALRAVPFECSTATSRPVARQFVSSSGLPCHAGTLRSTAPCPSRTCRICICGTVAV